jgi:hypothetical protein
MTLWLNLHRDIDSKYVDDISRLEFIQNTAAGRLGYLILAREKYHLAQEELWCLQTYHWHEMYRDTPLTPLTPEVSELEGIWYCFGIHMLDCNIIVLLF